MAYEEAVKRVAKLLDEAKIPYAITGALAVGYYGVPRTTYDVDVIVSVNKSQNKKLMDQARKSGFNFHELEVLKLAEIGNVVMMWAPEGYKIDFWLAKTNRDKAAITRRRKATVFDRSVWMISPEDLIVSKLLTGRPRDLGDIVGILTRQKGKLDKKYLLHTAKYHDAGEKLSEIMESAEVG